MKRLIISLFLLSGFTSANAELNLELPKSNLASLGGDSNTFTASVSDSQQGLKILRNLRASQQIIEDPEINTWIRALGNRLSASAPPASSPLYFVVSRKMSINAFATQGGVVVIHAGLILHTNSESELAAVIAHEIAHVTQRHISRMLEKNKSNQLATSAALLAGIAAGSKNSQAGQAIINTAIAGIAHKQLSFSREAESEADRVGLRILARAGFNPMGMPRFLSKLEQFNDDKYANVLEYVRSHPLTLKRVSDTQARAKRMGHYKGRENLSYLYMREKIRAQTHNSLPIPATIPQNIQQYAKALQLNKRRNYPQALKLLGANSKKVSEAILIAELSNKLRKYPQAIKTLLPLIKIYPDDEAMMIPLAQAYLGIGRVDDAWKRLNDISTSEQTSLEYFEIFQEISRLSRKNAQAYRAAADKNTRIGNYQSAAAQLRRAIKLPSASASEIIEMQQALENVEDKLRSH